MKKTPTDPASQARAMLDRARRYCALGEQCESGVRQKLIVWGANQADVDPIVDTLRAEGYLDDMRYARSYCESKMLGQHWSRQKTIYQLRLKHLPKEAIDSGLAAVPDESYLDMVRALAAKRTAELAAADAADADRKLVAFLLGRGFTMDEINKATNN